MALRVFLVEDSQVMREHLTEVLLNEADVDMVGMAETEHDAKVWLESHPDQWDVALVDLYLKEGTGAGVVTHCKRRRPNQTLLVMTGQDQKPLLHQCKLMGADAVYSKATELDDMLAYCIGLSHSHQVAWERVTY
jgi:two-component system OmpR family response regulator